MGDIKLIRQYLIETYRYTQQTPPRKHNKRILLSTSEILAEVSLKIGHLAPVKIFNNRTKVSFGVFLVVFFTLGSRTQVKH